MDAMKSRRPRLVMTMLVAAGATVILSYAAPAVADDGNAPAHAAGSRIQVDPQTGKRVAPGPSVALPASPAFSTSHAGLVEKAAPGGGVMIDLQGRFRSAATVAVGTDGTAHPNCVPPGAGRQE